MLHPPTDATTVQLFNLKLARAGYGCLPADFGYFLTLACGLQGPYCTLLGLSGMKTAGGGTEPGICEASDRFNAHAGADVKTLVLGRASGNVLLVFSKGKYHLLDVQTQDMLRSYDSVAAFIDDMITMKGIGLAEPVR